MRNLLAKGDRQNNLCGHRSMEIIDSVIKVMVPRKVLWQTRQDKKSSPLKLMLRSCMSWDGAQSKTVQELFLGIRQLIFIHQSTWVLSIHRCTLTSTGINRCCRNRHGQRYYQWHPHFGATHSKRMDWVSEMEMFWFDYLIRKVDCVWPLTSRIIYFPWPLDMCKNLRRISRCPRD